VEGVKENKTGQETVSTTGTSQGNWERGNVEKPHACTEHLAKAFQQHSSQNQPNKEEILIQLLKTPTNSNYQ
jgi:hypothetical protein